MNIEAYEALTGLSIKDGRDNWKSCCPVHDERTPSFYIHKETYICHCFGCGASGTLAHLLANRHGYSTGVVRQMLDIPLLPISSGAFNSVEVPVFAASWLAGFRKIMNHPFLERRGFADQVVMAHGARWDSEEKRVVFPLADLQNKTIGAVGRSTIGEGRKWYFYWNAPKSTIVYNLNNTLDRHLIIVEGIFDVMWLNQLGYSNTVALLGSHPSKKQVDLIKTCAETVTLFLDNDQAGRDGQKKLHRALNNSVDIRYANYQAMTASDPQEFDKEELDAALTKTLTHIEYVGTN